MVDQLYLDEQLSCGHRVPQFPCGPQRRLQPMGLAGYAALEQLPSIWCNSELHEPPAIWALGRERKERTQRQCGWISVDPETFVRLAQKPPYVLGNDGKPI